MQDVRRWYLLAVSVIAAAMLLYGTWRVALDVGEFIVPGVVMADPPLPEHLPPEVREEQLKRYRLHRDWHIRNKRVLAFRRLAGDLMALGAVYVLWRRHRGAMAEA